MRPIKLRMVAFGPYAHEQIIDFSELGDRSFFLIHGPTGAGKTTILDAICFALYGEPSGTRTSDQLRSQHTKTTLPTEVTFDFELDSQRYRITRRPKQEIPRERGEGLKSITQKATLWKVTGEQVDSENTIVIASTPREVKEQVEALFHFKREEFLQVMMLPQDQFRELLVADSAKREEIFQALFQTHLYERIEQELKKSAKSLQDEIASLQGRREVILQHASAQNEAELQNQKEQVAQRLIDIETQQSELRDAETQALNRLNHGKDDARKIGETESAVGELRRLESQQQVFESYKRTLALARKAADLIGVEKTKYDYKRDADIAAKKRDEAAVIYQRAVEDQQKASAALTKEDQREPERQTARQQLDRLESMRSKVVELADAQKAARTAKEQVAAALHIRDETKGYRQHLQARLNEAQTAIHEAEKIAGQVEALRLNERDAQLTHDGRIRLEDLQRRLTSAKVKDKSLGQQVVDIDRKLTQAREADRELNATWIAAQAAVLARDLADGVPCPVCGSVHHPSVATSDKSLPSEIDLKKSHIAIEQLEASLTRVRDDWSKHHETLINLEADIRPLIEQLGDQKDVEVKTLKAHLTAAQDRRVMAETQLKLAEDRDRELQGLKDRLVVAEDAVTKAEQHLREVSDACTAAKTRVEERERDVPVALRDLNLLDRAQKEAADKSRILIEALTTARDAADRANQAVTASKSRLDELTNSAVSTRDRAQEYDQQFQESVRAAGFINENTYQSAKQTPEQVHSLEERINKYEKDLHTADERVKRAREQSADLIKPDLAELERAWSHAKKKLEAIIREEANQHKEFESLTAWLAELGQITGDLQEKDKRYAVIGRLADVANGKNPRNLTFQRFVLAAKLDDVLREASKRLQIMSDARYHLRIAETPIDRRRAAGLDLEVLDTWAGETRPVKTLSGGEGFYTSLALALGLADVVQAYARGIRLDTIFVDEGFGSLDADKLDRAIQTLEDLKEGGRLVGIISHVDSLRERIPARLEVSAGTNGSTARFVFS